MLVEFVNTEFPDAVDDPASPTLVSPGELTINGTVGGNIYLPLIVK